MTRIKRPGYKVNQELQADIEADKYTDAVAEMCHQVPVQNVDNRDIGTTWLWTSDMVYIEVSPWDLVMNALENMENMTWAEQKLRELAFKCDVTID